MSTEPPIAETYAFLRDEIKREDSIVHQRLATALSFQGFLIAGLCVLLSSNWQTGTSEFTSAAIHQIKILVLAGIGIFGLITSGGAVLGVRASKRSTDETIAWWNTNHKANVEDKQFPIAYGSDENHANGHHFMNLMTYSFIAMWIGYLIVFANLFMCSVG
jgi:hypothetical protein